MKRKDLKLIIESIAVELLKEDEQRLERLGNDINGTTLLGKYWLQILNGLDMVIYQAKDFSEDHKVAGQPKLYTKEVIDTLNQIIPMLEKIYPTIKTMVQIQKEEELK